MGGVPMEVPMGSLFRIPIRLHLLFLVFLVLQVLTSIPGGGWLMLFWAIVLGPMLLFTVLIHELGHCLAARQVGGEAHGILLWPLGGLAFIGHDKGPKADMWVAVAGPLTHVPMVLFWVAMTAVANKVATGTASVSLALPYPEPKWLGVAVCTMGIIMNISLFVFNLLVPAYPLDGGRILVDTLLTCGVAPLLTAKITIGVAAPIALGIVIFGAVKFQMVTIMVGLWVGYATYQLFDTMRKGQLEQHPMFAFSSSSNSTGGAVPARSEIPIHNISSNVGPGQPGPYQQYQADPRFQI